MRLPTWEELVSVEEQLEVLEHPLDQSLFVVGPPGSGKTVLAVYRAQMVAEAEAAQTEAEQPVAIVTFSRMLRRLLALLDEQRSTYAKTMHSFVWTTIWFGSTENHRISRTTHIRMIGMSCSHVWIMFPLLPTGRIWS